MMQVVNAIRQYEDLRWYFFLAEAWVDFMLTVSAFFVVAMHFQNFQELNMYACSLSTSAFLARFLRLQEPTLKALPGTHIDLARPVA